MMDSCAKRSQDCLAPPVVPLLKELVPQVPTIYGKEEREVDGLQGVSSGASELVVKLMYRKHPYRASEMICASEILSADDMFTRSRDSQEQVVEDDNYPWVDDGLVRAAYRSSKENGNRQRDAWHAGETN